MPETITQEITIYDIEELREADDRGYEQALETLRQRAFAFDWWDGVLDSIWEDFREKWGVTFDPKTVTFDLDRGDFFAFKTANLDERTFLRTAGFDLRTKVAKTLIEDQQLVIGHRNYGYSSERMWIGYAAWERIPEYIEDDFPGTTEKLGNALRDMEAHALQLLRSEMEYLESEEYLVSFSQDNEYRWTQEGAIWLG